jgi:murein L,D-transpeptidase YcbB/YkuD
MRTATLLLAAILALGAGSAAEQGSRPAESDALRSLIARGQLPQLRHPDFSTLRAALDTFYRNADYAPQWLIAGTPARAILAELEAAPSRGLDPANYDVAWLKNEIDAIYAGDRTPERVARADVALTVAIARFASDLSRGRVSPAQAGFKFALQSKALDLDLVLQRGATSGNWHEVVSSLEPSLVLYQRLKDALARYRGYASVPLPPLPPLPSGKRKIEPGGVYAGVAQLAEHLRRVGDLPADAPSPASNRYEGPLVDAVRAFQERHGLKADGVLGHDTLEQIGVPLDQRVHQIELSLERLRWLPDLPPGPMIAVNVPLFRLWALSDPREDSAAPFTMPVIVGGAAGKETPVFVGEMRYVEFSPYWNVPPKIQRAELVPKLERDPGYWQREELEAVETGSTAGPVMELDGRTLEALRRGDLRIRQRPGPKNVLGGVKFVLPNSMDIYLHGTSSQKLFDKARRDLSHGCIRVADPQALAAFVLRDQPEWTAERINEAMTAGKMSTVKLTEPLPVVVLYTTSMVDTDGKLRFAPDIYGYDRKLEQALRAR